MTDKGNPKTEGSEVTEKSTELRRIEDDLTKKQDQLIKVQNEISSKEKESRVLSDEVKKHHDDLETFEKKLSAAKDKLNNITMKHQILSVELDGLDKTKETNRNLQDMLIKANNENDKKKKEIERLQDDDRRKKAKIDELEKQVKKVAVNYEDYRRKAEAELAKKAEKIQTQHNKLSATEAELRVKLAEVGKFRENNQQLEDKIQQVTAALFQKELDLKNEVIQHAGTKTQLMLVTEAATRMNSQLQCKENELQILQDEVNKAKIEARELTIRYHELPEKDLQFKRIETSNDNLRKENADLQEQLKEKTRVTSLISLLREQNETYCSEKETLQERKKMVESKYNDLVNQYEKLSEEAQRYMVDRTNLKGQLRERTDETEALKRQLQHFHDKVENLEIDLSDSQKELMNTKSLLLTLSGDERCGDFKGCRSPGQVDAGILQEPFDVHSSLFCELSPIPHQS